MTNVFGHECRAILKSDCYHIEGHGAPCQYSTNFYMLVFGVVQIIMSQIPNVHDMVWLSVVAAVMSFSYASIGFGLGFAKVIGLCLHLHPISLHGNIIYVAT